MFCIIWKSFDEILWCGFDDLARFYKFCMIYMTLFFARGYRSDPANHHAAVPSRAAAHSNETLASSISFSESSSSSSDFSSSSSPPAPSFAEYLIMNDPDIFYYGRGQKIEKTGRRR